MQFGHCFSHHHQGNWSQDACAPSWDTAALMREGAGTVELEKDVSKVHQHQEGSC